MFQQGVTCLLAASNLVGRGDKVNRQLFPDAPDQDLDEVFAVEEGGVDILDTLGLGDITTISSTITQWDNGKVPEACYAYTQADGWVGGNCRVRDMEVYSVTYDDCDTPWTMCKCGDANGDLEDMVNNFGQMPVAARQGVRHVMLSAPMDGVAGLSVYWEGDLIIFSNYSSVGLFAHEVAHNLDWSVWGDGEMELAYSDTQEWVDAVDNETCVTDWYAKSSYAEAYAQVAIMVAYQSNVGPLSDVVDMSCMQASYDIVEQQLGPLYTTNTTDTCSRRIPDSKLLCVSGNRVVLCDDDSEENSEGPSTSTTIAVEPGSATETSDPSSSSETSRATPTGNGSDSDSDNNDNNDNNNSNNDNNDNNGGNNGNSGGSDSNSEGSGDGGNNDDSAAPRGMSMGRMPMFLFQSVAQVMALPGQLARVMRA